MLGLRELCGNNFGSFDSRWYSGIFGNNSMNNVNILQNNIHYATKIYTVATYNVSSN